MSRTPPSPSALRVADLPQNAETAFALRPDTDKLKSIADELHLSTVRKLSFEGTVSALGQSDWQLKGRLGATVIQPCVVTLEPVTTRIDVDVSRQYVSEFDEPEDPEVEMSADDTTEALRQWIDPAAVMLEVLALETPDYPRKSDAALDQAVFTKPGETPMTDEDARPFAGLAGLKQKLEDDGA